MARRRGGALAIAVVVLAACAAPGVHTDSAQRVTTPPPPTTVPPSAADPEPPPPTSRPATSAPTPSTVEHEASTSSGDPLFPELGSSDLDVQSYDLRLEYDPADRVLAGVVRITTDVTRPLDELALDATELSVDAVAVAGASAEFEQTAGELFIRPAERIVPGAPVVVEVTYHDDDHARETSFALGVGWFPTSSGSYVLNEPDGARSWLPSNDHPSDKASWRFELTVPTGTTAVANGELVEERPAGDTTTWVWEQPEPMATYLIQILTGDYEILDGGTAGTVPLTNVALADDVERLQPYFDLTAEQLAFFEPLFGPYPLDRYGLAFTESPPGLAMETQGRSLFARDDFAAGETGYVEHLLLAHELAHQWFGNAVTPAVWGDLWLNESFASYAQWLWLEHAGLTVLEREADLNLRARQHTDESTGEPSAGNLFGYERYDGGAVVVHALRREIGDERFYELLQRWVADNDGTSRTTEDFIALAEEIAGRSLDVFFDDWLYAADVPDEYPA